MALSDSSRMQIKSFFEAVGPIEGLYPDYTFSYVALRSENDFAIIQGTLLFNTQKLELVGNKFSSENVKAGRFSLSEMKVSKEEFIEQTCNGKLKTPHGDFLFSPNSSGNHGAHFQPFHEVGLNEQRRLSVLSIYGTETYHYLQDRQPQLDWEVRGAATPYEGIQELLHVYNPGIIENVSRIDIAAPNPVGIDASSVISGQKAQLRVRVVESAPLKSISVAYRVLSEDKVVLRGQLPSASFDWETKDGLCFGYATIEVPKAAIVHAYAKYCDVVFHHYYFGDPTSFQNSRRAAYEASDSALDIFHDIFEKAKTLKRGAREFEAAISWLFWMLGFAPAFLGGEKRLSDAADILACTPNGNIAVVECTIGLLKDGSKLQRLHERTESVRRNLDSSSTHHVRVLPVIITAKTREEVRADLEQAEKLGMYVITSELIEDLINRTLFPQNADQLFQEAETEVAEAKAVYTRSTA